MHVCYEVENLRLFSAPKFFRKEMDNISSIRLCAFSKMF